ncbi:hypothetical protein GCM10009771_04730 [Nesterenkonia flava]
MRPILHEIKDNGSPLVAAESGNELQVSAFAEFCAHGFYALIGHGAGRA